MGLDREGKRADVNDLLDLLIEQHQLKNDVALARWLDVKPPVISKLRHGHIRLGATVMVRVHEMTAMPIWQIKALAGLPANVPDAIIHGNNSDDR